MFDIGDKVLVTERGFTVKGEITRTSGNLVWVKHTRGTLTTHKDRVTKI